MKMLVAQSAVFKGLRPVPAFDGAFHSRAAERLKDFKSRNSRLRGRGRRAGALAAFLFLLLSDYGELFRQHGDFHFCETVRNRDDPIGNLLVYEHVDDGASVLFRAEHRDDGAASTAA